MATAESGGLRERKIPEVPEGRQPPQGTGKGKKWGIEIGKADTGQCKGSAPVRTRPAKKRWILAGGEPERTRGK